MTENMIYAIVAGATIIFSILFPALSQGKTAKAAMESIARQPDAGKDIRGALVISMALMEALTIYGLLIALMLVGSIA